MVLACESIFSGAGLNGCQTTHSQKYRVRPDLPGSASNVSGKVQSHLCLTEWGQEEVPASTSGAAWPALKIMFCNHCSTLSHMLIRPFCIYSNFRCIEVVEPRGTERDSSTKKMCMFHLPRMKSAHKLSKEKSKRLCILLMNFVY